MALIKQGKTNLKYILIVIIIATITGGGIYWWQKEYINRVIFGGTPNACTQEAKLCPDGSYVGRTDPNCEFAPCPGQRPEGCKDLCGDGICQEIVCLAIGCPCPETKETCLQDCSELLDTYNWKNYRSEEHGFEVEYPNNWYFDPFGELALGGPFNLTTLPRSAYSEGGVLPAGGAEITIFSTSLSLNEAINDDSIGTQILKQDSFEVAGGKATRIIYKSENLPMATEKDIILYLPYQSKLYKFILNYYENDPKETEFIETFETILSTFKFISQ